MTLTLDFAFLPLEYILCKVPPNFPIFICNVVCHCLCHCYYLQVCDHLKEAAKFLRIQVVPIVGGLSMEKQERLLKRKPEIVVGTPGRLWELMSTGNQHLIKVGMNA